MVSANVFLALLLCECYRQIGNKQQQNKAFLPPNLDHHTSSQSHGSSSGYVEGFENRGGNWRSSDWDQSIFMFNPRRTDV
mmetsp:Transcript_1394/g.2384  ORF Transcript_1394/g.2384 Transcript_1394/m.2384 type:complete len:80 (-) Transcript_1394:220-459(-)